MLLKVGLALMLLSLVLAAGVAAAVGLRSGPPETQTVSSVEPRASEKKVEEKKFDPGKKLEIDDEPGRSDDQPVEEPAPKPRSEGPRPESGPRADPTPPPAPIPGWPRPTNDEVAASEEPRYFVPEPGAQLSLTVEALGLYDVPVETSDGLEALDSSLMHVPETSFPWDPGAQRNVYIAGHYLGWPGTASRLIFYNLDALRNGDEVILKDSEGRAYRYRVSESFTAMPDESWVMGQELNRDMVTLQTCIPPTFEERFIVRADRV
jgi:sortase A